MVEALEIFHALIWAHERRWNSVEICADCLQLVRGLRWKEEAHVLVRLVLMDILKLACNFSYVGRWGSHSSQN